MAYKVEDILDTLNTTDENSKNLTILFNADELSKDEELDDNAIIAARRFINLLLVNFKDYTYEYTKPLDTYKEFNLYVPNIQNSIESCKSDNANKSALELIDSEAETKLLQDTFDSLYKIIENNDKEMSGTFPDYKSSYIIYCNQVLKYLSDCGNDKLSNIFLAIDRIACDSSETFVQKYKDDLSYLDKALDIYIRKSNDPDSPIKYQILDAQMSGDEKSRIKALYNLMSDCFKLTKVKLNEELTKKEQDFIAKNKDLYNKWFKWAEENLFNETESLYFSQIKEILDNLSKEEKVELFHSLNYGYNIKEKDDEFTHNIFDKEEPTFKDWEKVSELYKEECEIFKKESIDSRMETDHEAIEAEDEMTQTDCKGIAGLFKLMSWAKIPLGKLYQAKNYPEDIEDTFTMPDFSKLRKASNKAKDSDGEKAYQKWYKWAMEKFPNSGKSIWIHSVKQEFNKLKSTDWKEFFKAMDYGMTPTREEDTPSLMPTSHNLWDCISSLFDKECNDFEISTNSGKFSMSNDEMNDLKSLANIINTVFSLEGVAAIQDSEVLTESIETIAMKVLVALKENDQDKDFMECKKWVNKNLSGNNLYHLYKIFNELGPDTRIKYTNVIYKYIPNQEAKTNFPQIIQRLFKEKPTIENNEGKIVDLLNPYVANCLASIVNQAVNAKITIIKPTFNSDDDMDIKKRLKLKESDNISTSDAFTQISAQREKEKQDKEAHDRLSRTEYENIWLDKNKKWNEWCTQNISGKDSDNFNKEFCKLTSDDQADFLLFIDRTLVKNKKLGLKDTDKNNNKVFKLYLDSWSDFLYADKTDAKEKVMEQKYKV